MTVARRTGMRAHHPAVALLLLAIPSSVFGQSFDPGAPRQTRLELKVNFETASRQAEPPAEPAALARLDLTWRPGPPPHTRRAVEPSPCQAWMDAVARRAADEPWWFGMSPHSRRKWEGTGEFFGSLLGGFLAPSEPDSSAVNRQFVKDLARGTTWDKGLPVWEFGCPAPASSVPIKPPKVP